MVLYFICPQSQIQDRQAASQIALLHSFSSFHELRVMNHHSLSLLESTLMEPLVSVANKELTGSPNPLESTLTKNRGGVGAVMVNQKSDRDFCPVYPEPRREREQRVEGSLLLSDEDACPKLIDSEGFGLFINVVFRFQPLQQRLKKRFRLLRRAVDGLRHFFGCVREVA